MYCFRWAVVSEKESVSMKNVEIVESCTQVLQFDRFQGPSMLLLEHHESSRWPLFRVNHHRLVLPGQSFAKHARNVLGNGPSHCTDISGGAQPDFVSRLEDL
jgi:hypothetical protein